MTAKLRGLYAITPEYADGSAMLADIEAALAGGCRIVQFRDKLSDAPERVLRARALRDLTRRFGARLLINDDLALARLIDADGVHLGKDDGNLVVTRAILGPDKILGASCYADFAAAQHAVAAGADYVAFGAVYPSLTKPGAAVATVDLFFQAKTRLTAAATCAIGGITVANAPPLIAAGADLLAVITDLFSASGDSAKITARASAYQRLFEEAHA
ncbi:MAG: thiamine phosphate synthase [Betaproteobacteria bacterium]|nr:thiamine phosphate synthase [Betaproteobacteria bacterium]MBK9786220.1 thiamine phosphate synthase [Candidatus Dechloromonas phosphorivorans]